MTDKSNPYKDMPLVDRVDRFDAQVPKFLRDLNCWGLWRFDGWDDKKSKWKKRNVAGFDANKPEAFLSFYAALDALEAGDGDGLSLLMQETPYVCIDIDNVAEGHWSAVYDLADQFGWWEYSAGNAGVHCFVADDELKKRKIKIEQPYDGFDIDIIPNGLLFLTADVDAGVSGDLLPDPAPWAEIKACVKKERMRGEVVVVAGSKRAVASTAEYELRGMLDFIDASNYEDFINYGHAIKRWGHEDLRGSPDVAFDIFNDWADSCEDYAGEDRSEKWNSFDISQPDGITVGSIVYAAKEAGWSRKSDAVTVIDEDGQAVTADYRELGLEGELRKFVGDAVAGYAFEECPVLWDNVLEAARYCFADHKGATMHYKDDGSQVLITRDCETDMMQQNFGNMINADAVSAYVSKRLDGELNTEAKVEKFYKNFYGGVRNAFWAVIRRQKRILTTIIQTDPFADELICEVDRNVGTLTLPVMRVTARVDDVANAAVVADFKKHLPEFDDIIRFIVMSRFADNRKISYLWLQGDSDFGKGLLFEGTGVFGGMGVVTKISVKDIERALEGAPSGVERKDLLDHWVLWVDEFKSVKSELKELDNYISASPKGQLKFTAPVYCKVFTSAEDVASLTGSAGVEDQFARRFNYIKGSGQISGRGLFKSLGGPMYTSALRVYAAEMMNELYDEMVSVGRREAEVRAEKWLREFHETHGIARAFDNLDDTVMVEARELADMILAWCKRMLDNGAADVRDPAVYKKVFKGVDERILKVLSSSCELGMRGADRVVIVKRMTMIVSEWLNAHYDRSEIGKIGWKKRSLAARVDELIFPDRTAVATKCEHENGSVKATKGALVTGG